MRGKNVAVVTGGAAGLGAVIVRRLHEEGWRVVFLDRDRSAGIALACELSAAAGTTFIECDLLDRAALIAAVDSVNTGGSVGLLVNNAGGWMPGAQFPDGDQWEQGLELNLHIPMLLTKLFLPALEGGGAVVNIASSGGWDSHAYASPEYGAAKAGLIRFTTAVAGLSERGVRVSCIVPHWIGLPRAHEEYVRMSISERERSGGLIDPNVIANSVVELAQSDDSAGVVVMIRADLPPYRIDPANSDPHYSS